MMPKKYNKQCKICGIAMALVDIPSWAWQKSVCSWACKKVLISKPKTCRSCGKEFQSSSKVDVYCSRECSANGRRDRKCQVCGGVPKAGRKFCSDVCRKTMQRKPTLLDKVCGRCGKTFQVSRGGDRYNKYCSKECLDGARRKKLFCVECGAFHGKSSNTYCGPECRDKAIKKRCKPTKPMICPYCKKTWQLSWRKKNDRYCSKKCREADARIELECDQCGTLFIRRRSSRKYERTFCSIKCQNIALSSQQIEAWTRFGNRGTVNMSEWRETSKCVRDISGNVCSACGGKNRSRALSVDHIIPRRMMLTLGYPPDAIEGLVALCQSCHTRKTIFENHLLKGDYAKFIEKMELMNYPILRVRDMFMQTGLPLEVFNNRITIGPA